MRRTTTVAVAALSAGALLLTACGGRGGPSGGGGAKISGDKIVLAVLNDQSGVYADLSGKNSVEAVKMAVDDFKNKHGDKAATRNIEVVTADHQNKPDIANTKAQELYDRQQADVILDVPTSSAALAVANVAKSKKKIYMNVTAATTELTGKQCNKYTFHYAYDTYMLANGTGTTVTSEGGKNWYIVYPDYAFGQDMERSFTAAIQKAGGTVIGKDPTPFPNDNFSTFLLKAPTLSPKPNVLGTMQAGGDLINLVKQYNEFKLRDQGIKLSVGLMFITDIHSLGPDAFAGTRFTDAWYWNFDDQNRAFAEKFKQRTGKVPTFAHAANYSAAMQYLEAIQRAGSDAADDVVKQLEGYTFNDFFARNGKIRAEDHRMVHDAYLAEVKPSSEVKGEWDYEKIIRTIPADQAFRPADQSGCTFS
ncbi:MAG TPA: ABC transporter substrate-binding protein [Pseudonocardiaceae bacterium]|jgi:branched-chain amino acid transport system substrate-binding protein